MAVSIKNLRVFFKNNNFDEKGREILEKAQKIGNGKVFSGFMVNSLLGHKLATKFFKEIENSIEHTKIIFEDVNGLNIFSLQFEIIHGKPVISKEGKELMKFHFPVPHIESLKHVLPTIVPGFSHELEKNALDFYVKCLNGSCCLLNKEDKCFSVLNCEFGVCYENNIQPECTLVSKYSVKPV